MEFPIKNQEEFDQAIKERLAREKTRWEKESGISDYKQRAEEAEARAYQRVLERDARAILNEMEVPESRHARILKNAELPEKPKDDGEPDAQAIRESFKSLYGEVPELFGEGARVSDTAPETGASDKDAPLSRERIESMSDEEINSRWDRIQAFLAGER